MNITELYEKLSKIDSSHEQTLQLLGHEKAQVLSDISGLDDYFEHIVLEFMRRTPVRVLDDIFKTSGLEFSPSARIALVDETNNRVNTARANILSAHDVATIDDLSAKLDEISNKRIEWQATDNQVRRDLSRFSTKYLNEFERRFDFELSPEYMQDKRNGGMWHWLTSSTWRHAKYAVRKTPNFTASYYQRKKLQTALDNSQTPILTAQFNAVSKAIEHYEELKGSFVSHEPAQADIYGEMLNGLDHPPFADALYAHLKTGEPRFLEKLVKQRGLYELYTFINGKMASLNGERTVLEPALSKLERAKHYNGTRSVTQDEEKIDRAIAGAKIQGAYMVQNVRAARHDTMMYSPAHHNNDQSMLFMHQMMLYQMYLGSPASSTDPHCAAQICGMNHDGAGLPAPDYAGVMQTLAADNVYTNLSLDGLGISAADLGSLAADVQSAVQSVSESISTISHTVTDSSSYTSSYSYSDSGGGFSGGGGDGGGGGGMCSVEFNDDVAVLPRGFREIRLGEKPRTVFGTLKFA